MAAILVQCLHIIHHAYVRDRPMVAENGPTVGGKGLLGSVHGYYELLYERIVLLLYQGV